MRTLPLIVTTACLVAGLSQAATAWWWPIREVRTQAYIDTGGQPQVRYQWRTNRHEESGTCFVILTDEQTGRFALTTAPDAVCAPVGKEQ